MSDPPTTSSEPTHHHQHHHHQQLLHLPVIHGGSATPVTTRINATSSSSTAVVREYRKGNWTLQETMILITAKKLDDERRSKANLGPPDPGGRKGGELRWKWVENYCWSHGCQRSQNQCNDKWDNLLRDYKKVREYESRACGSEALTTIPSYWKMEKHERKDKNLPSNMAFEVYQALNDVVQRKYSQRASTSTAEVSPSAPVATLPPLLPAPEAATTTTTNSPAVSESSSGTESSEKQKRRKVRDDMGSSIERSASVLAETLRRCEEQREIRHQQLMELHRRRLHIEETRNHLHRQGIADLVAAVANFSGINIKDRGCGSTSEGYGCLYSGEEVRELKEQNEAMQAELISIKTQLSQLKDQMPNLMHTFIHTMQHPPPTSLSQPPPPPPPPHHHHHSMDPSGSGGDA